MCISYSALHSICKSTCICTCTHLSMWIRNHLHKSMPCTHQSGPSPETRQQAPVLSWAIILFSQIVGTLEIPLNIVLIPCARIARGNFFWTLWICVPYLSIFSRTCSLWYACHVWSACNVTMCYTNCCNLTERDHTQACSSWKWKTCLSRTRVPSTMPGYIGFRTAFYQWIFIS